jgi:hypothetical protein
MLRLKFSWFDSAEHTNSLQKRRKNQPRYNRIFAGHFQFERIWGAGKDPIWGIILQIQARDVPLAWEDAAGDAMRDSARTFGSRTRHPANM